VEEIQPDEPTAEDSNTEGEREPKTTFRYAPATIEVSGPGSTHREDQEPWVPLITPTADTSNRSPFAFTNNRKILWDQPLLPSQPPPPLPQLPPQLQLAGLELEELEVELHLVEVPRMQMLETLAMPLMQPYVEQGLGLHLEEVPVVLEDLEDLEDQEDQEEVCLRQSQLHTWFQSQQTPMCALWAHRPESSTGTGSRPMPS